MKSQKRKKLGSNYSIYLKAVEYLPSPDGKSFGSHKRYALLATKKYVTADRLKEILEECGFFKRKEKAEQNPLNFLKVSELIEKRIRFTRYRVIRRDLANKEEYLKGYNFLEVEDNG